MAKFQIGDYVTYTNKTTKISVQSGLIVAINNDYREYYIEPEEEVKHYDCYKMFVSFSGGWNVLRDHFRDNGGARRPLIRVGFGSRNLKSFEVPYDPLQEPDEEDDI